MRSHPKPRPTPTQSQKEVSKLKDQLFKQKKAYEQKLVSFKKRTKLAAEGFKQDILLKDKEIERLKREVGKWKRKVTQLDQSVISSRRSGLKCKKYTG